MTKQKVYIFEVQNWTLGQLEDLGEICSQLGGELDIAYDKDKKVLVGNVFKG